MKKFLRTGAWYQSENKELADDLDISELIPDTPTEMCDCKQEIAELKKQVNDLIQKSVIEKDIKPIVSKAPVKKK